jgi:hypothetical protein
MTMSSMNSNSALLVVVLAAFATPVLAGTELTFDVVSHKDAAKGTTQVKGVRLPAEAHYTLTVTLSGDTLQIDEPDAQTRYDFKASRIDRVNKRENTYDETSLYAVVGFDVAELANRIMIGRAFAAAKAKDNPMAPALTENLMSMSDPTSTTVVDRTTRGDETIYSWNRQTLMTVSQKTRDVPAAIITQYVRFLRYSTGGHPQILAAIERGHGIPERLTIVRSNMDVETRTLSLRSIDERPNSPFSLDGYARETPEGE